MEGIEDRKARLRAEIDHTERVVAQDLERKRRELERLDAMPDFGILVNGTVLGMVVTYGRSRPYVVIGYKAADKWYLTGERSPNGVSSEEVAVWLASSGRRLERAEVLAEYEAITVATVDLGALLDGMLGR